MTNMTAGLLLSFLVRINRPICFCARPYLERLYFVFGFLAQYLSAAGIQGSNYDGYNPGAEPPLDSGLINVKMVSSSFELEPNLR
jgi:hypothetical protein